MGKADKSKDTVQYPGLPRVMDGGTAVAGCEMEASDGTSTSPAAPADAMARRWAEAVAAGDLNQSGRPLLHVAADSEQAMAATIAGMASTGLRTTGFVTGEGLIALHDTLFASAGKRLTTVLHVAGDAAGKPAPTVMAGHDGYHAVDDSGVFQLFAKDVQEAADLTLIAHRLAESALTPGIVAQDAYLTTHRLQSLLLPEPELIGDYLGRPEDRIDAPTPAQQMVFGPRRRRIPELWSVDHPAMTGASRNDGAHARAVAAQRPYYLEHVAALADEAMAEYGRLTGRRYARVGTYRTEDADYLIVAQGAIVPQAEAVADYLRKSRKLRVGVVNLTMLRPFPGDLLGDLLRNRKGVSVLERVDQPLAEDPPLMREVRGVLHKCLENGVLDRGSRRQGAPAYPGYPAYGRPDQVPPLFSACFGLGGAEVQPEALIGAVENMLPQGARQRRVYLSLDFYRKQSASPKQEILLQSLSDAYPAIQHFAAKGSENPTLLPEHAIAVRLHTLAGRDVFTPGDNLAHTLAELRGYRVAAWFEPGLPTPGQPTVYHLVAAPEPVKAQGSLSTLHAVLSADPRVFDHGDPLAGLVDGGVLILNSPQPSAGQVWATLPSKARDAIVQRRIQVYAVDAARIAREEAIDPWQQSRVMGKVLQGCFLATPLFAGATGLAGKDLTRALKQMTLARAETDAGNGGAEEFNLLQRGMEGLLPLPVQSLSAPAPGAPEAAGEAEALPEALKRLPPDNVPAMDLHGFWEKTGVFYAKGMEDAGLADPFAGLGWIPAATGLLRDVSASRQEYPQWIPEKCTGCGACWSVCPDSAFPGLVNGIGEVLETALNRVEEQGHSVQHLPRAVRVLEGKLRDLLTRGGTPGSVGPHLPEAIAQTVAASKLTAEDKKALEQEFVPFAHVLRDFPLAATQPFFAEVEKASRGQGGVLSVTLDPSKCKACMACVQVCEEEALTVKPQTPEVLGTQRRNWSFWLRLPTTDERYIQRESAIDDTPGLETLLLDKRAYHALVGGDHGAPGAADKTVLHLFAATVEAVMRPRVTAHLAQLDTLIEALEKHIRLNLAVDVEDTEALRRAMGALRDREYTLSDLSGQLDRDRNPIDVQWLERVTGLLAGLKHLKWLYTAGPGGRGRSGLGVVSGAENGSAGGVAYPYNPFPFPWTRHVFQESPTVALGIYEGHMARMAEGFRLIRMTELELDGKYSQEEHGPFFGRFGWRDFSEEEYQLCPPVVVVGGDNALYGAGQSALSALLSSGRPIKVLGLDTQAYRHVASQPGLTEGEGGEVIHSGAGQPRRQDLTLLGLAHQTAFILQAGLANIPQLLKGFMEGLASRRTALFSVYCASLPAHGQASDMAVHQSRLALESRAHPLFRYDPDGGDALHERISLEGNPALDDTWSSHALSYLDENGATESQEMAVTFADFAVTVPELRHHFRLVPGDRGSETLTPLAEYLDLDESEREETQPFIWAVDYQGHLQRLRVSAAMVAACEERRDYWKLLHTLTRRDLIPVDELAIKNEAQAEVVERVWQNLLELARNNGDLSTALAAMATPDGAEATTEEPKNNA